MQKKFISCFAFVASISSGLFGCATSVHTYGASNTVPDNQLALLATPGAIERKSGNALITAIDGNYANGWKYTIPPGEHTIELSNYTALIKQRYFRLKIESGKRYDITYDGVAYVRDRSAGKDDAFIGDDQTKPFVMLKADYSGIFMPVEEFEKVKANTASKIAAVNQAKMNALADQEKRDTEAKMFFATHPARIGQQICRETDGNAEIPTNTVVLNQQVMNHYEGRVKLQGFVEQENAGKIKITVSTISFNGVNNATFPPTYSGDLTKTNYKGNSLYRNSVLWDDKDGWAVCN